MNQIETGFLAQVDATFGDPETYKAAESEASSALESRRASAIETAHEMLSCRTEDGEPVAPLAIIIDLVARLDLFLDRPMLARALY